MDADLVLIFAFVLTILMMVTGGVIGLVSRNHRHAERLAELRAAKSGTVDSEKYTALEERVKVLERIATDRQPDLAAQIEQLRDVQDVDLQIEQRERTQ